MTGIRNILSAFILLIACAACNKQTTCPDYWQYPDCNVQSRARFYGMYKGLSYMDGSQPATTQWRASDAETLNPGEIAIAPNLFLMLDAKDTRVFTVKDGSMMGGRFIRQEGYGGRFTDDSLYLDFRLYDSKTAVAGESGTHYTFAGKKK